MMDIHPGQVYRRTPEHDSEWFLAALEEANRIRMHPINISIMTTAGSLLSGELEGTDADAVKVREQGEPDVAQIDAEDIEAFTLLAEPPPERGGELRD
jgi:hypothetical protein